MPKRVPKGSPDTPFVFSITGYDAQGNPTATATVDPAAQLAAHNLFVRMLQDELEQAHVRVKVIEDMLAKART